MSKRLRVTVIIISENKLYNLSKIHNLRKSLVVECFKLENLVNHGLSLVP